MNRPGDELARVLGVPEPEPGEEDRYADTPSPFLRHDLAAPISKPIARPKTLASLIYPGRTHTLFGNPGAGKTITGLWFLQQAIGWNRPDRPEFHVVHVDEETGPTQTADLLQCMGADPAAVDKYVHYFPGVHANWMNPQVRDHLDKMLADVGPVVALFDSSAAMMADSHLNENDPGDVRRFWQTVFGPIAAERHCAVIVIDHGAKPTYNGSGGALGARGSGDKLAVVDVSIRLDVVGEPFTRDLDGHLHAEVTKDRLGCLDRHWSIAVTRNPLNLTWRPGTAPNRSSSSSGGKAALLAALDTSPATIKQLVDRLVAAGERPLRRDTASGYLTELEGEGKAERIDQGAGKAALWATPAPPPPAEEGGMKWN